MKSPSSVPDLPGIVGALAIHPSTPDVMWAAPEGAGIYKSSDGAKNWAAANKGLAASWIEKIWGDARGTMFAQTTHGLFRTDGKGEWVEIVQPFSEERAKIDTAIFDPENPKVIHVGTYMQYFRSTDGGVTWNGIEKPLQDSEPVFASLVLDAKNSKILYSAGAKIFKSTNGGVRWKPAGNGRRLSSCFAVIPTAPCSPSGEREVCGALPTARRHGKRSEVDFHPTR